MDESYWLSIFRKAANQLDENLLRKKQMQVATGEVLKSVFLKLYKPAWANKTPDLLTAPSRIFFSVWIGDKDIAEEKICYNIHAFKLRQLNGYHLTSRQFATDFRKVFKTLESHWPNVRVDYGPLTLMQGWIRLDEATLKDDILQLAQKFLEMDHLIDELLAQYSKQ